MVQLKYGAFGADEFFDAVGHALDFAAVAASPSIQKAILLQRLLQTKRLLLVIDNFETIIEHAVVRDFLAGRPSGVRCVLTTSRKVLGIGGAATLQVTGFSQKETRALVEQKVNRGDLASLPNEDLLGRLHEQTGGTVLAIEWVLGRVKSGLSLEEVVTALPSGHGDLFSDLFDSAWADLSAAEKRCIELAAMMVRPMPTGLLERFPISTESTAESIVRIVGRNLAELKRPDHLLDSPLLELHPLTHIYSGIRLAKIPPQARTGYIAKAAEYFIELFTAVAEGGSAPSPRVVDRQIENAITVARLCGARNLDVEFVKLVTTIGGSLLTCGRISERAELCQMAASVAERLGDSTARLRLSTAAGAALGLLGRYGESEKILSETAERAECGGYLRQAARTRRALAASYYRSGQTKDATRVLLPARQWSLDASDRRAAIDIDYLAANIAYVEGRFSEVEVLCQRMIEEAPTASYERSKSYALEQLAAVRLEQGRRTEAKKLALESAGISAEHLDRRQVARANLVFAKVSIATGHPFLARGFAKAAAQTFAEVGLRNEELEAQEVAQLCSGLHAISRSLLRRSHVSGSMLKLPIGGD